MKKRLSIIVILVMLLALSGCGNQAIWDGATSESNTFRYVVTEEAGDWYLHKVHKWMDTESDALGVVTECCNNRIWTSYNTATLYENLPVYLPDTVNVCGGALND